MRQRLAILVLLSCCLIPAALSAAESGSISGRVVAPDGQGLAGARVTAAGTPLPPGRTTTTRDDGGFTILRLPPGEYRVMVEVVGLGRAVHDVVVAVERDTQLELAVEPAVSEEITVTTATPQIDLRSATVGVNVTQDRIEQLPLVRSYKGLFELVPGVSQNGRLTPNAGGSRLDNTFLLDGVTIGNPHYGDIVPDLAELDVAEIRIERAGISAELGSTAGMVVNAVTRSGGNELSGRARFEYQPASWASAPSQGVKASRDRQVAAAALGGPLRRDVAWFYVSASRPSASETDRANNLGRIPGLDVTTDEYFAKLTAQPLPSLYLSGGVRSRDTTTDNAGIGANAHPDVGEDDETTNLLATVIGTWSFANTGFLEGRLNRADEQNSLDPLTSLGYRPAFDASHPERMGLFTSTADRLVGGATAPGQSVGSGSLAVNDQDFRRDQAQLEWQSFHRWSRRDHDLRIGASSESSEERLARRANGWGVVTWNATTRLFTASYVSQQPPHTGRADALGAFAQDQIAWGERATLTLGLRVARDEYYGERNGASPGTKVKAKILTFDFHQQIQPRFGLTVVPDRERGDRVLVSLGRYSNTENKSLTRAASPTRIFTTRATFEASGAPVSEVPAANTQTKTVDAGLEPMYTDEAATGYARPLGDGWSAEAWAVYRDTGNIFEDVSADGLGNGPFHVAQLPDAYRRYRAATLQLRHAPDGQRLFGLWLDASYTWSRLSGNWDIDFSSTADSPFYNSSFIQDGPGVLISDNRDGVLRGDRTHVAKVFATIAPWQGGRVGTYVRYQSGGAWEARGLPDANVSSSSFIRYLERAGSRRMPDWLNVDLLVSHQLRWGAVTVELEGRVLNAFDEQVALQVDDRLILDRAGVPNNPNFAKGTVFSAPRAFVATATLGF